jgi:hypothetical protein
MSGYVPIPRGQCARNATFCQTVPTGRRHDEGRIGVKCWQTFIFNATRPLKSMDKYLSSSSSKKWVSSDSLYITLPLPYALGACAPTSRKGYRRILVNI